MILLIENDPDSLELYARQLSQVYDVSIAGCHAEAQRQIETHNIAAVIVEPEGMEPWVWDFLSLVKSPPQPVHIPVIFCTVLDQPRRDLRIHPDVYLVKPVYPQNLMDILEKTLSGKGKRIVPPGNWRP
jgi:response regulator RpfG family c-di-GMP phosphodiesterase